ncbi:hypothetical protein U1Q18_004234, partial [Sarracenia purpurea var. burkii]
NPLLNSYKPFDPSSSSLARTIARSKNPFCLANPQQPLSVHQQPLSVHWQSPATSPELFFGLNSSNIGLESPFRNQVQGQKLYIVNVLLDPKIVILFYTAKLCTNDAEFLTQEPKALNQVHLSLIHKLNFSTQSQAFAEISKRGKQEEDCLILKTS